MESIRLSAHTTEMNTGTLTDKACVLSQTALLVAVTANQPEIVQDLLSLGADINVCDVKGQTALHLAAHYGLPLVLQVTN